jgi:hypothetical protein
MAMPKATQCSSAIRGTYCSNANLCWILQDRYKHRDHPTYIHDGMSAMSQHNTTPQHTALHCMALH